MKHCSDVSRWTIRGLYLFALALVLTPVIDLTSTAWPLQPTDLPWRYGFLGLMAGSLLTPALGLVLAMAVAYWREHGLALRALGVGAIAAAAFLVLAMGVFMVDVMDVRSLRPEEMRSAVLVGAMLQQAKYGLACLVLSALGVGALKTASRQTKR